MSCQVNTRSTHSAIHVSALVRTILIVDFEIAVQVYLYLVEGLVELSSADDPEMLVEQRAMQTLDDAIALRPANLRCAMLNLFELEE
jgi:hypothetical protein